MLFLAPVIVIVCFVASAVFFPKHGKIPYYDTNFTTLQGTAGIDAVHRNALPHKGVWVYVLNSKYQLLLPRRGAHMKTCPSTLSIIGEHNDPEDKDWETAVRRGLREEIKVPQDIADMPLHPLSLVTFRHQYANGRTDVQLSWRGYVVYHRPLEFATMDRSEVDAADVKGKFYDLAVVADLAKQKPEAFCDEHLARVVISRGVYDICKDLGTSKVPACAKILADGIDFEF
jgi:isopentenyldiphosphate isomerase